MSKKILFLLVLFTLVTSCSPSKSGNKKLANVSTYLSAINTESLRTNLTYIASDETEGRETGSEGQKKAGKFIIDFYKKNGISNPKGADDYYQKVPAAFLNAKRNENLPDSENIWAFIEGSEKPDEIVVIFSEGPQMDNSKLLETLNRISPLNSQKWSKIR